MDSPSPPPPPTNGTPRLGVLGTILPDHIFSSDAESHGDVSGWPWCQSCRPYIQILLSQHAQAPSSYVGQAASAPTTMTLSSPFPDYIYVPALVHRSQLALFTTTTTTTTTSTTNAASPSPIPEQVPSTGVPSSPTTTAQRRSRGVKVACTNCRTANKRCDEGRPCARCIKCGQEDKCVSAARKQRRRTVKHVLQQTATTLSAVAGLGTAAGEDESPIMGGPTAVLGHIAAAGTSYVDDSHDLADGASCSSPSDSPPMADFDALPSGAFDFCEHDPAHASDPPSASASASAAVSTSTSTSIYPTQSYAFAANIWQPAAGPSSSSSSSAALYPASNNQQQQQQPFQTWGYDLVKLGFPGQVQVQQQHTPFQDPSAPAPPAPHYGYAHAHAHGTTALGGGISGHWSLYGGSGDADGRFESTLR